MTDTSLRNRLRLLGTTAAVVLALLLGAGAACDSQGEPEQPSVQEKLKQTHIFGQSKLRIGVATYEPLMGVLENGRLVGFDIEIARYIAASLGYGADNSIEFVHLATEDRIPALQSGQVDIVVSSFSITEERQKLVSFAGPYFVTTQEVMIPVEMKNRIRTIEDLRNPNYRVCVGGGSTTEAELEKHGVKTLVVKNVRDCVNGMLDGGKYDAVSSDETILAGFRSLHPTKFEVVDMPFGTSEQLGIGVPISDPALRDLVAFFLQKSYLAGRSGRTSPWLSAYHRNLGPWLGPDREQPPPLNVPDLVDFDDKAPM